MAIIGAERGVSAMAITSATTTAEELWRVPDNGFRYELARGKLIRMPPVGPEHGRTAVDLAGPLREHVERHRLGWVMVEVGYRLERDPDTVRAPDVSFLAASRIPPTGLPPGYVEGSPDLAAEVVSPDDTAAGIEEKVQELVVYPRTRTVTAYGPDGGARVLRGDDVIEGGDVVPGFALSIRALFRA
jgi:Uma2 family endonuclease